MALQWTPTSWDMGLGRFMPVFLLLGAVGLEDSHIAISCFYCRYQNPGNYGSRVYTG